MSTKVTSTQQTTSETKAKERNKQCINQYFLTPPRDQAKKIPASHLGV